MMMRFAALCMSIIASNGYILVTTPMNYANAEEYCLKQYGSHLGTIKSAAENMEVVNSVKGANWNVWFGLNDLNTEGAYSWLDGSTYSLSDYPGWHPWHAGEPNNGLGNYEEDCIMISTNQNSNKWIDVKCEILCAFVCNDMVESCLEENHMDTFAWDQLLSGNMSHKPYNNMNIFAIDPTEMTLTIEMELSYLKWTSSETGDDNYGTTYWLDFQPFNGNGQNKIYIPGSCGNRLQESYYTQNQTLRDFTEWWLFSERPYKEGEIDKDTYLAYPNPGNVWEISTVVNDQNCDTNQVEVVLHAPNDYGTKNCKLYSKNGDFATRCSRIKYNAVFSWSDLFGCNGIGNTIQVNQDDNFINLTGIFYVDVVSPFDKNTDSGYYRVYEVLSQPFIISLRKTAQVLSSIDINLFDIYLFSIFSENENGHFVINVITESADYVYLDEAILINYPSHLSNVTSITAMSDSISTSCMSGINGICRQIFQINVQFSDDYCVDGISSFNLAGSYTLTFNTNCGTSSICNDFVNDHGPNSILSFDINRYVDDSCNVIKAENISSYTAQMRFYSNSNYQNYSNELILYNHGDTVYVEVEATNLPQNLFDFVSLSLVNVWICQYDANNDDLGDLPDPQTHIFNGGCLANSTYDFDLNYRIFPTLLFDTILVDEDVNNVVRFSFKIPMVENANRDKLFIHAEVEISLSTNSTTNRRRTLISVSDNHLKTDFIQVADSIVIAPENEDNMNDTNTNINDNNLDTFILTVVISILLMFILATFLVILYKRKKCQKECKIQYDIPKDIDIHISTNTAYVD